MNLKKIIEQFKDELQKNKSRKENLSDTHVVQIREFEGSICIAYDGIPIITKDMLKDSTDAGLLEALDSARILRRQYIKIEG